MAVLSSFASASILGIHSLGRCDSRCNGPELWGSRFSSYGKKQTANWARQSVTGVCRAALEALIFDCDGVILESEDLHRRAYNATFTKFDVRCPGTDSPVHWGTEFYDKLQNQIGGGKPKMRWYFNKSGWPSSSLFINPKDDNEKEALIDALQDWKTSKYKDIIQSGAVVPRPGVLRLMDEARDSVRSSVIQLRIPWMLRMVLYGRLKLAVCSAATKSSVIFCLNNLLGQERFQKLDCFLAGDDVKEKKPDPSIYKVAAEKLGVVPENCLVVEDSVIGLKAAVGAGMRCIISFTSSTSEQDFSEAAAIFPDLGNVSIKDLVNLVGENVATIKT